MQLELIETTEDFERLADDWHRLESESESVNIFQSFDWVLPWWKSFGNGRELVLVFCRNSSSPVAALPFYRERRSLLGLPMRRIGVVGETLSTDYEFLFTGKGVSHLEQCFTRAAEGTGGWDYFQLKKVPAGSQLVDAMESLGRENGYHFISIPYGRYPYMQLEGDFDSFLNVPDRRSVRRNTRKSLKKLQKEGTVRFLPRSELDLDRAFEELVRLSQRGWKKKAGIDPFSEGPNREFFREVLRRMEERGRLEIIELELDGEAIAFVLGFNLKGKYFGYYMAYDEERKHLSPGTLLLSRAVEQAFIDGRTEFDFSEGQEYFKLQWTDKARQFEELYLLNRKSLRYPVLVSWLLMRRNAKGSPRIRRYVEALRNRTAYSIFV